MTAVCPHSNVASSSTKSHTSQYHAREGILRVDARGPVGLVLLSAIPVKWTNSKISASEICSWVAHDLVRKLRVSCAAEGVYPIYTGTQ